MNTNEVHANYANGVLEIKLGKRAEAKPKQIKVAIGNEPSKTIEAGGGKKAQAA